jgi:hypothetical protein
VELAWDALDAESSYAGGPSYPPPAEEPPVRLLTKGTAIGASLVAAAIVGGVLYFLSSNDASQEIDAPSAASARAPAPTVASSAAKPENSASKASASSEGPSAVLQAASAKPRPTVAQASSLVDAGETKPLPKLNSPHKVDELEDPPPTRLPPSGL